MQSEVAKIPGIGDRPDVEEEGQPTHNDSFPISTERESAEFDKTVEGKFKFTSCQIKDCQRQSRHDFPPSPVASCQDLTPNMLKRQLANPL